MAPFTAHRIIRVRDPGHGDRQLRFNGEIFSYDGKGSLSNTVLLNFIKNRYKRIFVTFDLDAEDTVSKTFKSLGFEAGRHYAPVGIDAAGKRDIEGLLPDSVRRTVYAANDDVVQIAVSGTNSERKDAKRKVKQLLLDEFRATASPGDEYYGGFYGIVDLVNGALNKR